MSTIESVDLSLERKSATIKSEEFSLWWVGGSDALKKKRNLEKLFLNDGEFDDPVNISLMSHKELYEHTLIKATKFIKKLRKWYDEEQQRKGVKTTTIESLYDFRVLLSGPLGTALFQQNFPLRLHFTMFLTAILGHGTETQQDVWLEKAWQMAGCIGTYAQTELGHGTFLRGLETRADYDIETQEFILNTPSLTAYKWWPGGLGHTVNTVVVLAQLYIKGKHCGLHPFLVRIRDVNTHKPMPGVDVGEIGPKLGSNGVNNGFLGFQNVRIPHEQMLMKHAQVLPDGSFVKGPVPLLVYGTMVFARVLIIKDVSFNLLQAATIATRFSAVRRQSPIEAGKPEPQIIDHLTQQAKVFPQIAKGVFYRLVADNVWRQYQLISKELDAGKSENLPELHAILCCLKAVCSDEAGAGVEMLRKSCGGHGYITSANFSQIYGITTATCTYEGENTVLLLQSARFLVKNYVNGLKRKVLPKSVTYLRNQARLKWSNELSTILRALEITATEKVRIAFEYQRQQQKKLNSEGAGANMAGLKLIKAAIYHGRTFLARVAIQEMEIECKRLSPSIGAVLQQLLEIFILEIFLTSLGDILLAVPLSARIVADVEKRYEAALKAFRRNAVAVVDGFDFHDRVLASTLGCYDGRVYERLMEEARKSPLNKELVNRTFETHLKPFMSGKL